MARIVIVAYKPKPGRERELEALMDTHHSTLKSEGLVTDRKSIIMRSEDGTIIEVFEWRSGEAIESAHANIAVQKMWQKYAEVCEYVPLSQVRESSALFSEFAPIN